MVGHSISRRALPAVMALAGVIWLAMASAHAGFALSAAPGTTSCNANPAGATNGCAASGPASMDSGAGVVTGAGNPINVTNGNKYQRETDLAALPGELGLEIVRHYNSSASRVVGQLGNGWRLSYETDLYVLGRSIQILQADGARLIFSRDQRGVCSSPNPAHGRVIARTTARGEEYTWEWPNGRKLDFNAQGRLEQIRAPGGAFVTLTRGPGGELLKVTDPQQRELRLRYLDHDLARSNPGRFRGVVAIDSPVGTFKYEHGGDLPVLMKTAQAVQNPGGTAQSLGNAGNLVKVAIPTHYDSRTKLHAYTERGVGASSISRIYHYEDPDFPLHLTGITVSGAGSDGQLVHQRIATYRYDATGRAVLSVRGEPLRPQPDGNPVDGTGIEQVSLAFPKPGTTLLTNSLGQTTTYRHAIVAGAYRLLEARGTGCASCGEVNVRYAYDSLGQLAATTRLDTEGRPMLTIRTERDGYGRIVKLDGVVFDHGRPGPMRWLLRYEYPATSGSELPSDSPVRIVSPSIVPGKEHSIRIAYNAAGQVLAMIESGWSPAIAGTDAKRMERSIIYGYASINGRSLLTQIDGPLATGAVIAIATAQAGLAMTAAKQSGTRLEWDGRGSVVTAITTPGGFRSTVIYDDAGRITEFEDAEQRKTLFTYDARNQLIATVKDGIALSHLYDAFGNRVETGYGTGVGYKALAHSGFDNAQRMLWRASHLGIVQTRRFDSEGKLLEARSLSASFHSGQRYAYDASGRLTAAVDGAGGGRRIAYNAQSLPEVVTDALGRDRRYRYDAMGRLTQVVEAANTLQARLTNTVVRFERDALDRVAAVIAPNGATTRYTTDDFGRTVAVTGPDSGTVTRSFDAADRLIASTDARGDRASYEYDAAGRIVKQQVFAGSGGSQEREPIVTAWRYQGRHLVAIAHPGQSEAYAYDQSGRLAARTMSLKLADGSEVRNITRYRYDDGSQLSGRLSTVSLPDGSRIEYRRNGQNQIVALERSRIRTSWLAWLLPARIIVKDIARDIVGLSRYTYGNGVAASYQRSPEGVLARIVYRQPQALVDHRYLWDREGNLLHSRDHGGTASSRTEDYAYDAQDRLIAAASSQTDASASYARYFYDGAGNRLLAQENIADQADTQTNTVKAAYAAKSNRWLGAKNAAKLAVSYDAAGQPSTIGDREYGWDALGRLIEVREVRRENRSLASYRYNHKGERIAKTTRDVHVYYLYEAGKLVAELDERGKITRQYVYLGDSPVAVIDTPKGRALNSEESSQLGQIAADIVTIAEAWLGNAESIAYLHTNHLGAPELATDAEGKPVWSVTYTPFGKVVRSGASGSAFKLNLRLPGQYEDEETGLHYNGHRYYDPGRGQYLTPDPLGLNAGISAGISAYAYAGSNPLKYVDPQGLILFAFDGTDNSNPPPGVDDFSNVYKFYLAYDAIQNGPKWYMNGVGRDDPDSQIRTNWFDDKNANTARARVDYMLERLDDYMQSTGFQRGASVNVDIVGFSRGAAMARDFSNSVAARLDIDSYKDSGACVNIRFLGLWDTVAQFGWNGADNSAWQLAIPAAAKNVFQAVALNEHRYLFPGESIGSGTQRGFIGSHADIGGSYGTGDLSDVALNWIVEQAKVSGVKMKAWDDPSVAHAEWGVVTEPVLHDKNNGGDRDFCLRANNEAWVTNCQKQRQANPGGMNWSLTASYIKAYAEPTMDADGSSSIVGEVNMREYGSWLKQNYGLDIGYSVP